ncbi:Serine/threonine protein kinase [Prosthecobacter debontii]|uniref:Serine/threonine protein kinase n=1 Tax=Prosthecobacter debontii TaxID=48467 RepID=A0A1T4YIZ1_9BACT|nr:serine/threonine-protein kinase [Prosthecobacter debontii]SKB01797.1 Serine/threonine protein kinase [Prosthecobacter debontii]
MPETSSTFGESNDENLSALGRAFFDSDSGSHPTEPVAQPPSAGWETPSVEELQKLLPQYEVTLLLGRGGMGAVYMGRQISLDRLVAIKILSADLGDTDQGFIERFKNEARSMAKLNHPGIVNVYDFGETTSGLLYIVMEFVEGTDVQKMISASKRLHTDHAMAITCHVCDALAYAHNRGIIHRDIKPANIMVGYDGSVKVADFGLAKMTKGAQTGLTQSGMAMGTLHYMAPEALVLGVALDHRVDIYAVGVMLYQMLTGKLPQGMFEMPSLQVSGLDPRYDDIIAQALRNDRNQRYQQMSDLRHELDHIVTQPVVKAEVLQPGAQPSAAALLPSEARPKRSEFSRQQPPRQAQPQVVARKERLWLSGVAVMLLIAGLGGAAWYVKPFDQAANVTSVPAVKGQWRKVYPTPEDIPDGRLRPDGWMSPKAAGSNNSKGGDPLFPSSVKIRNGGVRARFKSEAAVLEPFASVCVNTFNAEQLTYSLKKNPDQSVAILLKSSRLANGESRSYNIAPTERDTQPLRGEFVLELIVVGKRLIGKINGQITYIATDDEYTPGSRSIFSSLPFRDVEFLDLDGLPEDEALRIVGLPVTAAAVPEPQEKATGAGVISAVKGQWRKVFPTPEDIPDGRLRPDGWINPKTASGNTNFHPLWTHIRNGGFRVRFKTEAAQGEYASIRIRSSDEVSYTLKKDPGQSFAKLLKNRLSGDVNSSKLLSPENQPYRLKGDFTLEVIAVGNRLIGRVNGEVLCTATDDEFTSGIMSIYSNMPFRDIEVLELDGLPEDEAARIAGLPPATAKQLPQTASANSTPVIKGQWRQVYPNSEDIPDGRLRPDGWISPRKAASGDPKMTDILYPSWAKIRNGGIRARFKTEPDLEQFASVRIRSSDVSYALKKDPGQNFAKLLKTSSPNGMPSAKALLPENRTQRLGDDFTLELVAVGNHLIGRVNGEAIYIATDDEYTSGVMTIHSSIPFRDIEVLELDGLPEDEAVRIAGFPPLAKAR